MYGVVATINIKPGFKEPFMASMLEDADGSVNNEPGCLRFDVLEDNENPNRIYLMEEYVDEAAFQSHTPTAPTSSSGGKPARTGLTGRRKCTGFPGSIRRASRAAAANRQKQRGCRGQASAIRH